MKILFSVSHPGHVHHFKNTISKLQDRGHDIHVVAVDKEMTTYLLDKYGIPYSILTRHYGNLFLKIINLLKQEIGFYKIAKEFKPDLIVGRAQPFAHHIARLLRIKSILFTDTEIVKANYILAHPFAASIVTPACFLKNLGRKHIQVKSLFELAYLHPNNFKPTPSVLDELGLNENDTFFLVRFVSWGASHDIAQKGFSLEEKRSLLAELSKSGKVLISSEANLPKEFDNYRISIPVEKIHSLLYYSSLYIGEGATMATEAAVLGTPAIYVSSLSDNMGNFVELEKYGLVYSFTDAHDAIFKIRQMLRENNVKDSWIEKRDKFLKENIDMNEFMTELIEKYAESP
jgi:predicted glycosyltransferase